MALTKLNNAAISPVTNAGLPSLDFTNLPADSVIQVKHHAHTPTTTSTSSGTWVATGSTLSFTPKHASSDLYIQIQISAEISGATNTGVGYRLQKDGSTVYDNDYALYHSGSNDQRIDQFPITHYEAASNTNARTYTIDFRLRGGGQTRHNIYAPPTTMVIFEVAR